jgi:hypothetical protein
MDFETDNNTVLEITQEEFINLFDNPPPEWIVELIEMPESGILERRGDDYIYFIVPGPKYFDMEHIDPVLAVGGSGDPIEWAEYVFGYSIHQNRKRAALIDKRRRIAVEQHIGLPYEVSFWGDQGPWGDFGEALKDTISDLQECGNDVDFDHAAYWGGGRIVVHKGSWLPDEPDDRWRRE